ncbi:LysR family transcriptional regulator [Bosea vestrisii]|uniref:LysR family transcriptional regulator n=1 Tax=Bosea vestrisii TaxID=151416 RepID=UPI0024E02AA4|nr:LysR family transcriptional regulator [Bosea vestrisii]WID96877.1 LysR family transcriptional regulator [Bosea vestrisii]
MGEPAATPPRRDAQSPASFWADIEIFHAIASSGGLALAAAALGLSETTVARRLKAFEARLGLRLFRRGANRLIPTGIGLSLAADAAAAAEAVARFEARATSARARDDEPVRVTATTSISLFLTQHATTLSAAAGGVEIVILSTRARLDLAQGEAEIAIRMRRPPEGAGYFGQKVGRLAQAFYVRRDSDPATAPIISVSRDVSSRIEQHILAWAAGRPIAARVGDSAARYESIRSSGAVSMAPCFLADADAALIRLEEPPEATADEIFLVSHESGRQRPAVLAVLEALRKLFREHRGRLEGRG